MVGSTSQVGMTLLQQLQTSGPLANLQCGYSAPQQISYPLEPNLRHLDHENTMKASRLDTCSCLHTVNHSSSRRTGTLLAPRYLLGQFLAIFRGASIDWGSPCSYHSHHLDATDRSLVWDTRYLGSAALPQLADMFLTSFSSSSPRF